MKHGLIEESLNSSWVHAQSGWEFDTLKINAFHRFINSQSNFTVMKSP